MLMFIGSSFILYKKSFVFLYFKFFSMKDSKVLPTCLSSCEDVYPGHSQENRTSIAFGKENIAKWDGFLVNVEFANNIVTSD